MSNLAADLQRQAVRVIRVNSLIHLSLLMLPKSQLIKLVMMIKNLMLKPSLNLKTSMKKSILKTYLVLILRMMKKPNL